MGTLEIIMKHGIAVCACAVAVIAFGALTRDLGAQSFPDNTNIERMARGAYSFYEDDGETLRGREEFHMIVHGDGSRTMTVFKDMFNNSRQYTIVMRVGANFRPIESFSSYWQDDGFKGSIRVTLDGNQLHAASWGPGGPAEHTMTVPPVVAVITHAEALNSWNASVIDPNDDTSLKDNPQPRPSYFISPTRGADGPVLGSLRALTTTRLGEETVTTPAGTFDTIHYTNGPLQVWAMKGDRILVKQTYNGQNYVLTEYEEDHSR